MEDKSKSYVLINVNVNFKNRLDDFIEKFEEKYGVKISYAQATKIIDEKIKNIGGLKV